MDDSLSEVDESSVDGDSIDEGSMVWDDVSVDRVPDVDGIDDVINVVEVDGFEIIEDSFDDMSISDIEVDGNWS